MFSSRSFNVLRSQSPRYKVAFVGGAVGVEEGAVVLVPVRLGYSDFMQPVFTRPHQAIGFIALATASFESRQLVYEHNSTVEIADSRLQLADSVPLAKRMGWTRSIVGMRVTSFDEEGTIDGGTARSSGWTKLRHSRRNSSSSSALSMTSMRKKRSAHKWLTSRTA